MDTPQTSLFDRMKARMDWLDQRQRVLAQNVANADTPGYRPNDLKPFRLDQPAEQGPFAVAMRQTAAGHMASAATPSRSPGEVKMRRPFEVAPAGNAVDIEEQMAKVGETMNDHRTMSTLYRKYLGLVKTAINSKG